VIFAALLLAAQSVEAPTAVMRVKASSVDSCVANQRLSQLYNRKYKQPDGGYRLVYTLTGNQQSLAVLGSHLEKQNEDTRWTILPVLKGKFLFTLEINGFRGNEDDLTVLTQEVCKTAIEQKVKLLGWQLIDRNRTVAGASDYVDE
jgi:hypothetical protein